MSAMLEQKEHEYMIDLLIKDALFIESIEAEYGGLRKIYPDWINDLLVYEFLNNDKKCSDLSKIIEAMKEIDYLKQYEQ